MIVDTAVVTRWKSVMAELSKLRGITEQIDNENEAERDHTIQVLRNESEHQEDLPQPVQTVRVLITSTQHIQSQTPRTQNTPVIIETPNQATQNQDDECSSLGIVTPTNFFGKPTKL